MTKKDMKGIDKCYWNRPNGEDCSNWDADKVNKQLDWCEANCSRYQNCFQVAYLNNRLVELENYDESYSTINKDVERFLEDEVINFADYKKPKEEEKTIVTIDSVKCEWAEGPIDEPYFEEGKVYPYEEFQKKLFEYDYKVWNAGDYIGGYDKVKYTANITVNGEKDTYTGRIDLGDGKYGKEHVSIIDNMKELFKDQLPNAEITTQEPPYELERYKKEFGTLEDNQDKYLAENPVELPKGQGCTGKPAAEIAVGDIFYDSDDGAYGKTYYNFYRVTKKTKASIWVEKLETGRINKPVKAKGRLEDETYFYPTDKVVESRWIDTEKPFRLKDGYSGGCYASQGSGAYAKSIYPWSGNALKESVEISLRNRLLKAIDEAENV